MFHFFIFACTNSHKVFVFCGWFLRDRPHKGYKKKAKKSIKISFFDHAMMLEMFERMLSD